MGPVPELRSAGRATAPSKQVLRGGASAPNYFLQDAPPLRANRFSGGGGRLPRTTFCRTRHLSEQTVSQGWSVCPELLSAGRATSPSKQVLRGGSSAPNYFLQDVPPLRANSFSGLDRLPPNYFLQDVPPLRSNSFSGAERLPPNYFLQDVPLPQANTLSGTERHPRNSVLQDVPPPQANTLAATECQFPELFSAGRAPLSTHGDSTQIHNSGETRRGDERLAVVYLRAVDRRGGGTRGDWDSSDGGKSQKARPMPRAGQWTAPPPRGGAQSSATPPRTPGATGAALTTPPRWVGIVGVRT